MIELIGLGLAGFLGYSFGWHFLGKKISKKLFN